jgi:two-component system, chemotaxis family, protein-glutamate methylesterase/glutaminase
VGTPANGQAAAGRARRDLVVIGASAGGVDALQEIVAELPPEFPAAMLVVLHVASSATSVLPQILARRGPLPAAFAKDGDELTRGQIFVAPADHHMLVRDGHIRLTRGPRENGHRPAIDPLFRSAARARGGRAIGVVLSGLLDDGALGLRFIKQHGGSTVVQDPDESLFPSMPRAALELTNVDRIASPRAMARVLCELIEVPIDPSHEADLGGDPAAGTDDLDRVELADPADTAALVDGPPSSLTCPECGGALWEQEDTGGVRFACHVGHAYSLATLVEEQGRSLEMSLWSALRALEERANMHRRLARRSAGTPRETMYKERAHTAEEHARVLRAMLTNTGRLAAPAPGDS